MGRKVLMFLCVFAISLGVMFFSTKYARKLVNPESEKGNTPDDNRPANVEIPSIPFRNITKESGVTFQHTITKGPQKLLPEQIAGGVCVLDIDNDNLPDLFFPNTTWPSLGAEKPITGKLYRNLGGGKFADVTEEYGLAIPIAAMGVCAGDYDNDGFIDLVISCVGAHRIFHNDGGKKFTEVTQTTLPKQMDLPVLRKEEFLRCKQEVPVGTSCTFVDYDADGKLDLFVCQYVVWSPQSDVARESRPREFTPAQFAATQCKLYRNIDGKTFADVSAEAGVEVTSKASGHETPIAAALGVLVCDPNDDGFPDLIVTNDGARNFFFLNTKGANGKRVFVETAERVSIALPEDNKPLSQRGVDFGEIRPNKFAAIIGTAFNQLTTLHRVESIEAGYPKFIEVGGRAGIADNTRYQPKFSPLLVDLDLDGRQDVLISTAQTPFVLWNSGEEKVFTTLSADKLGQEILEISGGRGLAVCDLDGDGDLDLIFASNGGTGRIFQNDQKIGHHWIRLNLVGNGVQTNRSAIGAKVTIEAGAQTFTRYVSGARGFLSQSELTVTIGLGKLEKIDKISIRWPNADAKTEEFTGLKIDTLHTITEGTSQIK